MQNIGVADTAIFIEQEKLFDHNRFCISVGHNDERKDIIAIRWYSFPANSWCLISEDIAQGFLQSLLTNIYADTEKIKQVLSEKYNGR
jgi:hypothetical protein